MATLIFLATIWGCVSLEKSVASISNAFEGNTTQDFGEYSHEERQEYRRYKSEKKLTQQYNVDEIIKRLETEDERKGLVKKSHQKKTVKSNKEDEPLIKKIDKLTKF